jgi:YcxB-like protein
VFDASYQYSSALARRAYLQWLWVGYGGALLVLPGALVAAAVGLLSVDYRLLSAFVIGALFTFVVLLARSVSSMSRHAADYAGDPIRLHLGPSGITFSSAIIESTTPWNAIRTVVHTRDFLVLSRRGSNQPTLVPKAALTSDALAFPEARVRETGGRVRVERSPAKTKP